MRYTKREVRLVYAQAIVIFVIVAIMGYGYIMNIVKLTECDFEPIGKAEILRVTGILVPPVGAVMGYLGIKDN